MNIFETFVDWMGGGGGGCGGTRWAAPRRRRSLNAQEKPLMDFLFRAITIIGRWITGLFGQKRPKPRASVYSNLSLDPNLNFRARWCVDLSCCRGLHSFGYRCTSVGANSTANKIWGQQVKQLEHQVDWFPVWQPGVDFCRTFRTPFLPLRLILGLP